MPKPFICKNCGFDLELSPKHACTPASEISELDALKAQVERLRIALAATRQPHMDYIPMLDKTAQQVLDETPAQCLAEIKAQAVEDAAKYLSESIPEQSHESVIFKDRYVYISTRYMREYANQLRQAKEHNNA